MLNSSQTEISKQGLVSFEGKKKWLKKIPFDRYGCLMTILPKMMTD